MKKYIKPTAKVVNLSVKESLSALPANLRINTIRRTTGYVATVYSSNPSAN